MSCSVYFPTSGLFLDDENNVLYDVYGNILTYEFEYALEGHLYDSDENALYDGDNNILTYNYLGVPDIPCPTPPPIPAPEPVPKPPLQEPYEPLPLDPSSMLDYMVRLQNSMLITPNTITINIKSNEVINKSNNYFIGHTNPNSREYALSTTTQDLFER